jgi:LysR family hydrogen peroxide-inducible transcriptional activator
VARTGSCTKAAEDLGITQPSLSDQIARLEQGLGAPLFERLHRRIELTPLGEAILGKAKALRGTTPADLVRKAYEDEIGTVKIPPPRAGEPAPSSRFSQSE